MAKETLLIYGANGYTGRLISTLAVEKGLRPTLAGRNERQIQLLANELKLPYMVADLNDSGKLLNILQQHQLVIHAAGPFARTARPMIEACLKAGTHYIDITGEIEVFELAKLFHREAVDSNIVILPGAGFDVVPTDCLSLFLKNRLPDATSLQIAFTTTNGGLSHGTASTMVSNLGSGGTERINGKLVKVPLGRKGMYVDFGSHRQFVMSIPWGDVSTAFHTTSIPNIITYTGVPRKAYLFLKFQRLFNPILRSGWFKKIAQQMVDQRIPSGPDRHKRKNASSMIWAQVLNDQGEKMEARLSGPDGYTMTAETSLLIADKILAGTHTPGYHSPAGLFGEDLIMAVPGMRRF